jgi:hypothetical protein
MELSNGELVVTAGATGVAVGMTGHRNIGDAGPD